MDIRRRRGRTPLGSFINDIYFHQTHSHNRHPKLTRLELTRTSLVAQIVKHLPTTWETQVQSLGWEDLLKKWQPTPVFLPGESHGWRSLIGYSPWGRKESDTTERVHFHFQSSLVAQMVKYLPTLGETGVQSLRWKDLLKKWQPTPVFLPGKSHGQRSLVGYSP